MIHHLVRQTLAAIATLLRRRPLWWLSLGVGAGAIAALVVGLL